MEVFHLSRKQKCFVYLTHFFTTIGARMWWFGIGVFIIEVAPDSLQMTALYGFSNGGALLLLSTVIGDIIDKTARLKAARIALILNNLGIALCCAIVFFVFTFRSDIEERLPDRGLLKLCFAFIIILTIFSNLCNLGRTLVMERDWIVEICGRKKERIATMSATFRFIDLLTNFIAPLVTGQLMTYASNIYGPIFIGCWNIVAIFIEYWLIGKVYTQNPMLHSKDSKKYEFEVANEQELDDLSKELKDSNEKDDSDQTENTKAMNGPDDCNQTPTGDEQNKPTSSFLGKLFFSFISLYRGWSHYKDYQVSIAGLSLAFLYFTVLGFDNITMGYAYSQGMTESILGITIGLSSCFGIIASIAYPFLRKRFGLLNTGLIGLTCQISCLTFCIISVWLPGGTFGPPSDVLVSSANLTCVGIDNSTTISTNVTACDGTIQSNKGLAGMSTALIVLFLGILGARFGVWTADLVITQLFLETVDEKERGLVNGFQSSLNKLMDMLKFVMVIFISDPAMFGYPAIVSYCFICSAWILFVLYKKKSSGVIFCKSCI